MTERAVSIKNNKNEILEAYHTLLGEVQAINDNNRVQKQKRQQELEVVTLAESTNTNDIIHQIANLKVSAGKALDELSKELVSERDKLSNLHAAISTETKRLEELHHIKANADSLEALILAQKKKKEEFEKDLIEKQNAFEQETFDKRESWKKEQSAYEVAKKEREEAYKKEIKRREEEYEYQRQLKEQKDADQYEVRKAALERELEERKQNIEKELQEREASLLTKEQELNELREASKSFTEILRTKVEEVTNSITNDLQKQYKFEKELQAKETEGQISLYQQTIISLEDKLKEKQVIINEINKQVTNAQAQAQELAKRVVEGVSQSRQFAPQATDAKEERK